MFKKLNDDELQEWLEKQMEKENRSLENNFFSGLWENRMTLQMRSWIGFMKMQ